MLKKFEYLIYANESEKKQIKDECLQSVMNEHQNYSKKEILNLINSDIPNDLNVDYEDLLLMSEGTKLFTITAEKFGYSIWNGKAWRNKTCKRKCPFGEVCSKHLIQIDDECFCYGQLYSQNIQKDDIIKLSKKKNVKLLKSDMSIHIDLDNANRYQKESFGNFFFDFDLFIFYFGDIGLKGKINGNNVIRLL